MLTIHMDQYTVESQLSESLYYEIFSYPNAYKKIPNTLFIYTLYSVIRKPHSHEFIANFLKHSDKGGSTVRCNLLTWKMVKAQT